MVFYFIGLGLSNPEDISVRGLRLVQGAKRVYLEMYTAILMASQQEIEETYKRNAFLFFLSISKEGILFERRKRKVILADRTMVEQESDIMLEDADKEDVCFLVVGDVFAATTHSDLVLRCKGKLFRFQVVLR